MKYLIFTLFLLFAVGCSGTNYSDVASVKDELVSFDFYECKSLGEYAPEAVDWLEDNHWFTSDIQVDFAGCYVDDDYFIGIYVIDRNFESFCDQNQRCLEARKTHGSLEREYPNLVKSKRLDISKENVFIEFSLKSPLLGGTADDWSESKETRDEIIEIFRKDFDPDVIR